MLASSTNRVWTGHWYGRKSAGLGTRSWSGGLAVLSHLGEGPSFSGPRSPHLKIKILNWSQGKLQSSVKSNLLKSCTKCFA